MAGACCALNDAGSQARSAFWCDLRSCVSVVTVTHHPPQLCTAFRSLSSGDRLACKRSLASNGRLCSNSALDSAGRRHSIATRARRSRGYWGGPEARRMRALVWPLKGSTQMTRTSWPGVKRTMSARSAAAVLTRRPATDVITSPEPRPACAAGDPCETPCTAAPVALLSKPSVSASDTPRKAVGPTCTFDVR